MDSPASGPSFSNESQRDWPQTWTLVTKVYGWTDGEMAMLGSLEVMRREKCRSTNGPGGLEESSLR
jgi:hypothetical protein